MAHLAHIINPVKLSEKSELARIQPITFQSMQIAKNFTKNDVQLVTTQYIEDKEIIPEYFHQLSNLSRSVLDVNTSLEKRKLPLIKDILGKFKEISNTEYLIYTNVDIALMPYFYDSVQTLIAKGHDAIIVNRRRLKGNYKDIDELPLMYADLGKSHPGFDCFVFHKDLLDQFILDDICVGISFLEATLIHNLLAFAKNPLYLPDAHLTFHIGMDVLVPRKQNPFYWHNRKVYFEKIAPKLQTHYELRKFPYSNEAIAIRALKHAMNPALFTRDYIKMEIKSWKDKFNEWRWDFLQE